MAILRVKTVAADKELNLNQLYERVNTARAQRGKKFVAMGTIRRYWYSTETGATNGKELDQISWEFLQEVAGVLGVSVYDLLPTEDGLGNPIQARRAA